MREAVLLLFSYFVCIITIGQDTLIYEDFSSGSIPSGWSNITNDNHTVHPSVSDFSNAWTVVDDPFVSGNMVIGSTSYFDPVDRADRWLISAEFTLGGGGNMISWFARSHDPSFPDSYKVLFSTSGDGLNDFTDTLIVVSNENPDGSHRTLHFHDSLANENMRIAIVNNTFNGFKLYIDSIYIRAEDPLNVEENTLSKVNIYPNPASNKINIKTDEVIESVTFIDALGKRYSNLEISSLGAVEISHLKNGIYFVELVTKDQSVIRRKIIKQ